MKIGQLGRRFITPGSGGVSPFIYEVSGSYPNRPAGTGVFKWIGADRPTGGGTTAGGAGAVNGLDIWGTTT